MIFKPALVPSLLHLVAAIVLLYFSSKILAKHENERDGLIVLTLNSEHIRRDTFGPVQSIATQITGSGASTLVPEMSFTAAAASKVTDALSSIASEAVSMETSVVSQVFASNYTVGTKYACAATSCKQIPSLELVLCFGLFLTGVALIASALAFRLPVMKLCTLGCSMLAMLFVVVFAACAVSISELGSLAGSTFFHVEKGDVFAQALWVLGAAIILVFSAVGIFFMNT